jgi:uncharacterized membrane protein YkvI
VLTARRRLVVVAALAVSLLVTLAGPAGAAPVLADDQFKWFYWVGPLLVLSLIGIVLLIGVGYYVRVLRPKWRGQKQS